MKRDVDIQEISDGRFYSSNDMVKLGCAGCGGCCKGMGSSVVLDPLDVCRLSENLGKTFDEMLSEFLELQVVDGEGAVHPVALSCQEDGTIYTGELELPLLTGRSFAASAVFRAGGMAYTRPLLDVTVSQSGWSGEVLWTEKP